MTHRKRAAAGDDVVQERPRRTASPELTPAMLASVAAGRPMSVGALGGLQRAAGNAAVQRLVVSREIVVQRDANTDALAVASDMSRQFKSWKGLKWNRGAWWGSPRPGDTTGAKNVPAAVGLALKPIAISRGWFQAPSFTGGVSFHKKKAKAECDFIYHMQAP